MPRSSVQRLAGPVRMFGIGAAAVVLLGSMVGLAGGFEQAEPEPLPSVAVDEVFEGEPWNVAVSRAVLLAELEPARLRDPDRNHWLAVVAEIEITAAESRGDVRQVVAVSGIEGLVGEADSEVPGTVPPYDVRIVRDATPVVGLHPGLTERVVYLWERANDAPTPAEIEVRIIGKTPRESTVDGYLIWVEPQPRARVTVPLADQRDQP